MQSYQPLVRRVPWMGKPVLVARMWSMYRSKRTAHCELYTHPDGWELRLIGNHTFPGSRPCATVEDVLSTQDTWRSMLARDGWGEPGSI